MALGKTVSYQPFNETSFGYGSNEIATAHATEFPNATDIVIVSIEHTSGNWDSTGHLATPSIGTAVATYHKEEQYWTVKGQRDHVDAVLAAMAFFPADKAATRTWVPTALKANQTTGTYTEEEPPTIGNTLFTLKVYDGASLVSGQTVTFSVTEAVFGNQRPFWSVAPTVEDLNSTAHDAVAGGLIDLGTISHGTDTENVRIRCQFRPFGTSSISSTGSLGAFTDDSSIFVGDKKPGTRNSTDSRLDFTGSVAEAQAYLDNVRYYGAGNQTTFDMYLTASDGVVGAEVTKTCYFSDAIVGASTLPDVHYIEDENPAYWDLGDVQFTNVQPDVNYYTATITIDATGRAGCADFDAPAGFLAVQTYVPSTGVLTLSDSNLSNFKTALRNLEFTPVADFNTSFNFTVDFTLSNSTLGTSYTSVQQSVAVTAQDVSEVTANINSTYQWTEDQRFDLTDVFQITHGRNDNFDVTFTISDVLAGLLSRHGSSGFFRIFGSAGDTYKLSGTRDEVNVALQDLFFAPKTDYNTNFTIAITVDRTSGDLTLETQSTGTFTMNAVPVSEFSFPLTNPVINWENNVSSIIDTGLRITDTSADIGANEAFGTTYTVVARLQIEGAAFPNGILSLQHATTLVSNSNDLTNTVTFTGSYSAVNLNLQELKFIPAPLFNEAHDFYIDYKITRDFDGLVLLDFAPSVRTDFKNPTILSEMQFNNPLYDWIGDTPFDFDSGLSIVEKVTENPDYDGSVYPAYYNTTYRIGFISQYFDGSADQGLTQMNFASNNYGVGMTFQGTGQINADALLMTGTKSEINTAIADMRMTPNVIDFLSDPSSANGGFFLRPAARRLFDNDLFFAFTERCTEFNAGADTNDYLATWTNVKYTEDIKAQYIFSHLDDVIVDGAGDLFDVSYDVSIRLANETTGKFESYVADGYLIDDSVNIFVNDYEVRLVGTKFEVNEAIKQLQFTPLPNVATNVDIHYTQKRTSNNTVVTHVNDTVVTTMLGINVPEFVLGTSNNNIQYFVQDEFFNGVDTTKSEDDIINRLADVQLTPRQLATNLGHTYDLPIEILDNSTTGGGPALFRIEFETDSLSFYSYSTATLNITDTGYQSKAAINEMIKDGVHVINVKEYNSGATGDQQEPYTRHSQQYQIGYTVSRKDFAGTVTQLGQGNLTYSFLSGLSLWKGSNYTSGSFEQIENGILSPDRLDNLPLITDANDLVQKTALQSLQVLQSDYVVIKDAMGELSRVSRNTDGRNPTFPIQFPNSHPRRPTKVRDTFVRAGVSETTRGEWSTNIAYVINDIILYNNEYYRVVTSFTSGQTFVATNLVKLDGLPFISSAVATLGGDSAVHNLSSNFRLAQMESILYDGVSSNQLNKPSITGDILKSSFTPAGDQAILSQTDTVNFGLHIYTQYGVKLFVGSTLSPLDIEIRP